MRLESPQALATADQWRYVQGATDQYRLQIAETLRAIDEHSVLKELLPPFREGMHAENPFPLHLLLKYVRQDLSPERRIALSQWIDRHLEEYLQGHIFMTRCDLKKLNLSFVTPKGGARNIMYEHMPTWEATGTTLGGLSEALIKIEKDAPESKKLHAHPGWRIVTSLTSGGKLALPDRIVPLTKGVVTLMKRSDKHSFLDGIYLTMHGNEPGYDNEEGILWLDEDPPSQ
jgi:hypothetical protein